jgi:hypothetical protein
MLALPFAGAFLASRGVRAQVIALACAAGWTVALAVWSFEPAGPWGATARAISPVVRRGLALRAPSDWLNLHARGGLVLFDEDPRGFDDMTVSYYSGLDFEQQLRRRAAFYERVVRSKSPSWLVLFEGGRLEQEGAVTFLDETHLAFSGSQFVLQRRFERITVYRSMAGAQPATPPP